MPNGRPSLNVAKFPRQKIRLRYPRSRLGCLPCRRAHKKCDEAKPFCTRCQAGKLACIWPGSPSQREARNLPQAQNDERMNKRDRPVGKDRELATDTGTDTDLLNFLGLTPLFTPLDQISSKAAEFGPHAPLFLQHYMTKTCDLLVTASASSNPLRNHVQLLAFTDDLVLQALVALGGIHLAYKSSLGHIHYEARRQYGRLIRKLRVEATDLQLDFEPLLRILLVQLFLCFVEAFADVREGTAYYHLRASRQLIPHLLRLSTARADSEMQALCGLVLEFYAYLSLVTISTPYKEFPLIDFDPRDDVFLQSLGRLQQYETFGSIISCTHPLLEYIPRVSQLAQRRQYEMLGEEERTSSAQTLPDFEQLYEQIENVQIPLNAILRHAEHFSESLLLIQLYRHALLISLIDAMWGRTILQRPERLSQIKEHATAALQLLPSLSCSSLVHICCWPVVIIGSCLWTKEQQNQICKVLEIGNGIGFVHTMREVLEMLWTADRTKYFGPYGLYQVMLASGIVLCLT